MFPNVLQCCSTCWGNKLKKEKTALARKFTQLCCIVPSQENCMQLRCCACSVWEDHCSHTGCYFLLLCLFKLLLSVKGKRALFCFYDPVMLKRERLKKSHYRHIVPCGHGCLRHWSICPLTPGHYSLSPDRYIIALLWIQASVERQCIPRISRLMSTDEGTHLKKTTGAECQLLLLYAVG